MNAPRPNMKNKQQNSIKLSEAVTWKLSIVESWIYHHLVPKCWVFWALGEQPGSSDTLTALLISVKKFIIAYVANWWD